MHDAEAVGRGGRSEIVALEQGDLETAQRGVPRDAGAVNSAADHHQIVHPSGQLSQVALHGFPTIPTEPSSGRESRAAARP